MTTTEILKASGASDKAIADITTIGQGLFAELREMGVGKRAAELTALLGAIATSEVYKAERFEKEWAAR
jgi:hypothetical protein